MRRILPALYFIFSSLISPAQTKLWNGNGDGSSWNDALNWTPAVVPSPADDVLLDNSIVTTNYTVNFPAGNNAVSINSLTVTPSHSNNIIIRLPATNTSASAFMATGSGDAVVLNSGAIFINSSGAANGTPVSVTANNFFRINNGGKYVHNTARGHTNNLAARLSIAAGTENGIFEFDVPAASYTISLSGRTYGNLVLSSTAAAGNITYSGNGINPMNVNGDFQINAGVTLSIGMSADFIVNENYYQAATSTFNVQNTTANNAIKLKGDISMSGTLTETGTGLPAVEMNGTINQRVSITGSIVNNIIFRINNAAGATLYSPLILPYNLDLQNGKIKTDLINIATLIDNATVTGGSSASFVEGPMRKIGDDQTFSFPVGKGSIYAPVSYYSPGMAVTDVFEAEYFRANPQAIYGTNYENSLVNHISYAEYWQLQKTVGDMTLPVNVALTITQYSFAEDINSLYIERYNSFDRQWKNSAISLRLAGAPSPPYITGSITSGPITQSGIFTLATNESDAINPLPVNLISFKVAKVSDGKLKIAWQLAADNYSDVAFEVERSANGNEFIPLKTVQGNSTDLFYTIYDEQQNGGMIRYRLKMINANSRTLYSNIITLDNNLTGWVINLFPNPVSDNTVINIISPSPLILDLTIYDISGKEIQQWSYATIAGINHLSLPMKAIKSGMYFLSATDGKTKGITRFVKM